MAVADCFAEFQGGQFKHAQVVFDDETVEITKVSRVQVSLEQLPADFWAEATAYSRGGDFLEKNTMLSIVLIGLDDNELVYKSKPITLVTPASSSHAAAAGSAGGWKRHVYADPPMNVFGEEWVRQVRKQGGVKPFCASWNAHADLKSLRLNLNPKSPNQVREQGGVNGFFASWNARADLKSLRLQPLFRDPWVPLAEHKGEGTGVVCLKICKFCPSSTFVDFPYTGTGLEQRGEGGACIC
jgi:hypothetical protein